MGDLALAPRHFRKAWSPKRAVAQRIAALNSMASSSRCPGVSRLIRCMASTRNWSKSRSACSAGSLMRNAMNRRTISRSAIRSFDTLSPVAVRKAGSSARSAR